MKLWRLDLINNEKFDNIAEVDDGDRKDNSINEEEDKVNNFNDIDNELDDLVVEENTMEKDNNFIDGEEIKSDLEECIIYEDIEVNAIDLNDIDNKLDDLVVEENTMEKDDYLDFDDDKVQLLIDEFDEMSKSKGIILKDEVSNLDCALIMNQFEKFVINAKFYYSSDLNNRSSSFKRKKGIIYWDRKKVVKDLATKQYSEILNDKFKYENSIGGYSGIPLLFYFDLSGSMYNFSNELSTIIGTLLNQDMKVLIGSNEDVEFELIKNKGKIIDNSNIKKILDNLDNDLISKVNYSNQKIDDYVLVNNVEKLFCFSDSHTIKEMVNLSKKTEVYYVYFQNCTNSYLENFDGYLHQINNRSDIEDFSIIINEFSYKALCTKSKNKLFKKVK